MSCLHKNFKVEAKVARLTETEESEVATGYTMDIEVHCMDCLMPFKFMGMRLGYSPSYPTTSFEQTEARIPIEPV